MIRTRKPLAALCAAVALTLPIVLSRPMAAVAAPTLPFSVRFAANANGAIIAIGNNVMTCPDSAPTCTNAKLGKAPNNNNNAFDMINLDADTDPSTFNSSMSTLALPDGATVLWAGLYWGARLNAGTNGVAGSGSYDQMSLRAPGQSAYRTIAASTSADAQFGPYSAGSNAYQRFADVTSIVQNAGNGDYWGANVVGGTGQDRYAGWSLVVAYQAPGLPLRNLTVFDGFANVGASSPQTITVTGFQAPLAGSVDTSLTMVAYEGDLTQTGDFTKLNGTQLATALSPGSNFFNSSNDYYGASVATRNPADRNMLGFDIKNLSASGVIPNGATSATFTFGSTGDAYYPGVLTTAINLYAPDFTASSKTAVNMNGNSPAQPGDIVTYTVKYVNTGQDPATNLVSTDQMPAGTQYVPGSLKLVAPGGASTTPLTDAPGNDVGEFTGNSVVVRVGDGASPTAGGKLDIGAMASYSFQVKVLTAAAGTTVSNIADLAYTTGTTRIKAAYDTVPVTFDVRAQADVSITKTISPRTVAVGAPMTATLTVTNRGPNTATGVQVSDPIDGWLNPTTDVSGAPAGTTCTIQTGPVLTCTLPDMANGAVAVIKLTGKLAPGTPASQLTLTNIARVSAATFDPDTSNNLSSDTVQLTRQADLLVTKSLVATSITPGNKLTYNVTVTNNGPSDATGVILTDVVPSASTSSLTLLGATSTDMTCPTGAVVNCTMASLPAGQSASVVVSAQVAPSAAQGDTVTNTASVTAATPDPNAANNTASVTSTVGAPSADVRLTKTANPATLVAGNPVTYTITATNYGPSNATGVSVTDTLPGTVAVTSASSSRGACTVSGQVVTCAIGTLLASLDAGQPGASATVTIVGRIAANASDSQVVNTASVTSATSDPDLSNNQATATAALTALADVAVSKTATLNGGAPTVLPAVGNNVVYTITVTNNGPSDAQNVTLDDVLPAGLDLDTAAQTPAGVTCDTSLHCTLGTLAAYASVSITVPTVSTINATTAMDETVTVASDTPDNNLSNNTATWTLNGDPQQADLQLDKTTSASSFAAGGIATYDLTVTNDGPEPSAPTVTDVLPAGLEVLTSGDAGSSTSSECTISGQTVTCGDGTLLAVNDSVTYHLSVSIDPNLADGSTLTNTAHVDGSIPDPSMSNNDSTLTVPVTATADMMTNSITWNGFSTLAAGPGTVLTSDSTPNGTFVWLTMTFTNNGPATAQNASFTIDYDLNLTNLAISGAPIVDWNWTGTYAGYAADPDCHLVQGQITCPLQNGSGGTSIAPDQVVTVAMLIGVRGANPASGKGWVNVATTTSEGDPANYQDDYKEVPLTITEGLTQPVVTKTAAAGPGSSGALVAGGTFSYTIQVYQQQHIGLPPGLYWSDAAGVNVSDDLPTGFNVTSVTTSQGTCTNDDASFSCDVGTVAGTFLLAAGQAGPKVTVTVSGTIDSDVPAGTGIPNIASVTTTSVTYPGPGPFTAEADVDVVDQADLRVFKFVDQTPDVSATGLPVFYAGGQVGYTLVAFNSGPSDSGTSTLTDTLPLGLTLDADASAPACTVTTPGDVATNTQEVVTCPVVGLPAGTGQMFRLVTTTSPLDTRLPGTGPGCVPGEPSLPWDPSSPPNVANCDQYPAHPRQIDNTAVLSPDDTSAMTDPNPDNNTATVSAVLDTQADIAITATVSTPTPAAGDTVTYTAVSINNGPSVGDYPLGDVTFPPGFVPISWDIPGNICTLNQSGGVYSLHCEAIPAAPLYLIFLPGQAVTSVIEVRVPANAAPATYTATGFTTSATPDPDMTNNTVKLDVTVRQVSDLHITKTLLTPTPLVAGEPAQYRLTVTNSGPSVADGVTLSDTVPEGMTFVSAQDPTGAACPTPANEDAGMVVHCSAGTIPVGGSASALVTFRVDADAQAGQLCNLAIVGSLSSDPNAADNESQACSAVVAQEPPPVTPSIPHPSSTETPHQTPTSSHPLHPSPSHSQTPTSTSSHTSSPTSSQTISPTSSQTTTTIPTQSANPSPTSTLDPGLTPVPQPGLTPVPSGTSKPGNASTPQNQASVTTGGGVVGDLRAQMMAVAVGLMLAGAVAVVKVRQRDWA